jgi:ATP-dependent DNA ligase
MPQRYAQEELCAWCFDLMALNGQDLEPIALIVRKQKLAYFASARGPVRAQLRTIQAQRGNAYRVPPARAEGIVSKRKHTPNKSGKCD